MEELFIILAFKEPDNFYNNRILVMQTISVISAGSIAFLMLIYIDASTVNFFNYLHFR